MHAYTPALLALCAFSAQIHAQVTGSATGFAAGVTGGGDATPASPSDIAELKAWLTDDTPRVIMIDKTFDFTGSEGTKTETGCIPASNTCGSSGQDSLNGGADWCGDYPQTQVTYDVAGATALDIKGDKSIVGVGDAGVIKGKGFRMSGGVSNIIFQNIFFTDLNPQYIWGGDILTLTGTDMVWIDHCKFSLTGRQMIVTGYDQAGRVTISNNEFDGQTQWSSTCNGDHYWTMLFLGSADKITLSNNYIHDTSGRSPKVGSTGSITMQAVNNYWENSLGHAFDVATGGNVLIEGNIFSDVTTPITTDSASDGGYLFNVPDSSSASTCSSYIGRACVANSLSGSGDFASYTDTEVFGELSSDVVVDAVTPDADTIVANAGVGKLSGSASSAAASNSAPAVAASSSAPLASGTIGTVGFVAVNATSGIYLPTAAPSSGFSLATYPTAAPSASAAFPGFHRCRGRGRHGFCPDRWTNF